MSAPAVPKGDLTERILAAVRAAEKPVSFTNLAKSVKVKKAESDLFGAALESAVDAGHLYRWPDRRRSQYFWRITPEQASRDAVLKVASNQALSKSDLSKAASRNLHGLPVKHLEPVVSALLAEKELQAVPAFTGNSKLLVRAGGYKAYFNAARSFVEKRIRSAGFDPAAFFTEDSSQHDKLTATQQVETTALILEAVRSLEPVRGVPVSTMRLRNHIPNLTKHEFDAAALELRKKQHVFLSQHVDPYNISQDEKDLLIDGQDGTYYVAIAIR